MPGSAARLGEAVLVHVRKALVFGAIGTLALVAVGVRVAFVVVLMGVGVRLVHELARRASGPVVGHVLVFMGVGERRVGVLFT